MKTVEITPEYFYSQAKKGNEYCSLRNQEWNVKIYVEMPKHYVVRIKHYKGDSSDIKYYLLVPEVLLDVIKKETEGNIPTDSQNNVFEDLFDGGK